MNPETNGESFDPRTFPIESWWFRRPASIHGLSHTRRVLIRGCAIAAAIGLEADEFQSLVLAVAWHDIGRTHDGRDWDWREMSTPESWLGPSSPSNCTQSTMRRSTYAPRP